MRGLHCGIPFEALRHALTQHQWLTNPDFDQDDEIRCAAAVLAASPGLPLLAVAQAAHAWLQAGGSAPAAPGAALIRHWVQHHLLRIPVPLTDAAALRADTPGTSGSGNSFTSSPPRRWMHCICGADWLQRHTAVTLTLINRKAQWNRCRASVLSYTGRPAATGDPESLRYGPAGLGVLAMVFLPRLFRRFRTQEPKWIESDELHHRISAGDPIILLDVRQRDEFITPPGHLPSAVNVPLAELTGRMSELAERKQPIVVVCKTDRRSASAAAELLASGLEDVAVLRGGTDGWHRRGLALE